MIVLLGAAAPTIDWARYYALTPTKQFVWKERGNELNKAMLCLMISKNKNVQMNLRLTYSKGYMTTYLPTIKGMARYLST